jgi:hypothetical protein
MGQKIKTADIVGLYPAFGFNPSQLHGVLFQSIQVILESI